MKFDQRYKNMLNTVYKCDMLRITLLSTICLLPMIGCKVTPGDNPNLKPTFDSRAFTVTQGSISEIVAILAGLGLEIVRADYENRILHIRGSDEDR